MKDQRKKSRSRLLTISVVAVAVLLGLAGTAIAIDRADAEAALEGY